MAVPKIKGIIPIGIQDNSSGIIDLLNRISQSAGAGYQSGQNLGLNFLNLLGRQTKQTKGFKDTSYAELKNTFNAFSNDLSKEKEELRNLETVYERNYSKPFDESILQMKSEPIKRSLGGLSTKTEIGVFPKEQQMLGIKISKKRNTVENLRKNKELIGNKLKKLTEKIYGGNDKLSLDNIFAE